MEEKTEDKQRIIKINENIAADLDFVSDYTDETKSEIIEREMLQFIKSVEKGLIPKQPNKKAVGIIVKNEVFDTFKEKCKEMNYQIGDVFEIILNNFNQKNIEKINKELSKTKK